MTFTPLFGCTGFEMGSITVISSGEQVNASIESSIVHTGAYSVKIRSTSSTSNGYIRVPVNGAGNEIYVGAWIRPHDESNYYVDITVYGGAQYVGLRHDGTYWDAYVGAASVASGTIPHAVAEWHLVELKVIIDNSGTIESKIDGTVDIIYNGDTYGSGDAYVSWIRFFNDGPAFVNTGYSYIDDLTFGTDDWPGDVRYASALVPEGDTAQLDWTPSSGSLNYALIDEVGPNDADYVSTDTSTYKDLYTLSDWTAGANETPVFIVDWMRAQKDGADPCLVSTVVKSASTENSGGSFALDTSFGYFGRILMVDPDTTVTWTEEGINALEIGQEYL